MALGNYVVSLILLHLHNEDKDDDGGGDDSDGDDVGNAGLGEESREGSSRDSPQGGSRLQWEGESFLQQLEKYDFAKFSQPSQQIQVKLKDYLEILDVNDIKVGSDRF